MLAIFWILIVISVVVSLLTSARLLIVANYVVPPMKEAVPSHQWTDSAASLASLSEFFIQYPILAFVLPVIIICCGIYWNKKLPQPQKTKFATILTILSVFIFLFVMIWTAKATYVMQEQMVAGMGLVF